MQRFLSSTAAAWVFFLLCFLVGLFVLSVASEKSDRLHRMNLCESAKITENLEYLDRCKNEWGIL